MCPKLTIGCRIRTTNEMKVANSLFNPTNIQLYDLYSYLGFKCSGTKQDTYLNTKNGRCIATNSSKLPCEYSKTLNFTADC
jgi:hypothetical protein